MIMNKIHNKWVNKVKINKFKNDLNLLLQFFLPKAIILSSY
jgi:hypothetical protein